MCLEPIVYGLNQREGLSKSENLSCERHIGSELVQLILGVRVLLSLCGKDRDNEHGEVLNKSACLEKIKWWESTLSLPSWVFMSLLALSIRSTTYSISKI